MRLIVFLCLFILTATAGAATWYVDNTASGANNGTDWNDAWTSLASASGASVAPGDIVYISGGPAGSSHTYSGTWTPKPGSSGNRITYQIGQDAAHNGTAIFTSATCMNTLLHVNIIGDASDGQRHFDFLGTFFGQVDNMNDFRIGYCTATNLSAGSNGFSWGNGGSQTGLNCTFRFDHNVVAVVSGAIGVEGFCFLYLRNDGGGYDQMLITDNTFNLLRAPGDGVGHDGFQADNGGLTFSNNTYLYTTASYANGQHGDAMQLKGGSYIKVLNNTIINCTDIGVYCGGVNQGFNHLRIENNVLMMSNNAAGPMEVGADVGSGKTFNDVLIANNLVYQSENHQFFGFATGDFLGTFTSCYCVNNIAVGVGYEATTGGEVSRNNVFITSPASAATNFVSAIWPVAGGDFHLKSNANSLIKSGTNCTFFFNFDKDGSARQPSGLWDIGPYAVPANTFNYIQVVGSSVEYSKPTFGLVINSALIYTNIIGDSMHVSGAVIYSNVTAAVRSLVTNNTINVRETLLGPGASFMSLNFILNGITYTNYLIGPQDAFIIPFPSSPPTPTSVAAFFFGNENQINWSYTTDANQFVAYRSTNALFTPGNNTAIYPTAFETGSGSSFNLTWFDQDNGNGAPPSGTYYYYVVAQQGGVSSPLSSRVTVTDP